MAADRISNLQQVGLPTDQGRYRRPDVARPSVQRPQWRKVRRQSRPAHLENPNRLRYVSHSMVAKIDEIHSPEQTDRGIGDEHLIQVVIPLAGESGGLNGYLEGTYRIDGRTLADQKERVLDGVLTAVVAVLSTALLLYPLLLGLLRHATRLSRRLLDSNLSLIRSLGNAVAKRDSDTDAHNYRVTLYAVALAEKLHWPKGEIAHLIAGAFLHDVGKIGIPDHILLKPGKLTEDEFEIMKTHALLGLDIVAGNAWMNAAPVIRSHHERFDGSGYPDGLSGLEIPRGARLFAVVDVFDALVSARPYKVPLPFETALALIENESGRHFDPEIVIAFSGIIDRLYQEVAMASGVELHAQLRSAIFRYFNTEAGADDTAASFYHR